MIFTTRGWERAEWDAAADRLAGRGLLDKAGELTERGVAPREEIEAHTDRVDAPPYALLGAAGVARLTELASALARTALGAGTFPAHLLGKS